MATAAGLFATGAAPAGLAAPASAAQGFADPPAQYEWLLVLKCRGNADHRPTVCGVVVILLDIAIPLIGKNTVVVALVFECNPKLRVGELAATEQPATGPTHINVE